MVGFKWWRTRRIPHLGDRRFGVGVCLVVDEARISHVLQHIGKCVVFFCCVGGCCNGFGCELCCGVSLGLSGRWG